MTVIWVNGTFGAGKTTTATKLVELTEGTRLFDPEFVGYMLRANLSDQEFTDFQQLPPWRTLVPVVMDEVARFTGHHLVAVQTVLVEDYWREISEGLRSRGYDVFHVLLDADAETLHTRIDADSAGVDIRPWRHEHVARYLTARPWMLDAADLVIDTTKHTALATAQQIRDHVGDGISGR